MRKTTSGATALRLRVIKLVSSDGTVSVLVNNLFDQRKFQRKDLIRLYFRRLEIEVFYRDEKTVLEIEKFHGKTCNSVYQELFAAAIMTVIARTLMVIPSEFTESETSEYQLKNARMTLASEVAVLTPDDSQKASEIITEIIKKFPYLENEGVVSSIFQFLNHPVVTAL